MVQAQPPLCVHGFQPLPSRPCPWRTGPALWIQAIHPIHSNPIHPIKSNPTNPIQPIQSTHFQPKLPFCNLLAHCSKIISPLRGAPLVEHLTFRPKIIDFFFNFGAHGPGPRGPRANVLLYVYFGGPRAWPKGPKGPISFYILYFGARGPYIGPERPIWAYFPPYTPI